MTRTEINRIERRARNWNARLFNSKTTHKEFCASIGMKAPQFSRYINCVGNPPTKKTAAKINNALCWVELPSSYKDVMSTFKDRICIAGISIEQLCNDISMAKTILYTCISQVGCAPTKDNVDKINKKLKELENEQRNNV